MTCTCNVTLDDDDVTVVWLSTSPRRIARIARAIDHHLDDGQCRAMCHTAKFVNTVKESKALNLKCMPMVIIAASGMETGERVLHHLKAFALDPHNTILFAGFQTGGMRGAAMCAGADSIKIRGKYVPFMCRCVCTFITHGEPDAADALRNANRGKADDDGVSAEHASDGAPGVVHTGVRH